MSYISVSTYRVLLSILKDISSGLISDILYMERLAGGWGVFRFWSDFGREITQSNNPNFFFFFSFFLTAFLKSSKYLENGAFAWMVFVNKQLVTFCEQRETGLGIKSWENTFEIKNFRPFPSKWWMQYIYHEVLRKFNWGFRFTCKNVPEVSEEQHTHTHTHTLLTANKISNLQVTIISCNT